MHRYLAFGLQVDCEWQLPDLLVGSSVHSSVDVSIVNTRVETPAALGPVVPEVGGRFAVQAGETFYGYPGLARYRVLSGNRIEVDPDPGADEGLVRHVLLGPVFATLLWQRDLLTLHACVLSVDSREESSASIGGRTCGFMANSGEGKSTLASALYARGHRMLSDDIAVIPWRKDPLEVLPGYPRMKVYPEVLVRVGVDPESRPRVHQGIEKRAFMAKDLPTEAQPLRALYVLTRGETERAVRLEPAKALLVLMAQSYRPNQQVAHLGSQELMRRCARVVQSVPVFALERPRDLSRLDLLARFIEAHVAELA